MPTFGRPTIPTFNLRHVNHSDISMSWACAESSPAVTRCTHARLCVHKGPHTLLHFPCPPVAWSHPPAWQARAARREFIRWRFYCGHLLENLPRAHGPRRSSFTSFLGGISKPLQIRQSSSTKAGGLVIRIRRASRAAHQLGQGHDLDHADCLHGQAGNWAFWRNLYRARRRPCDRHRTGRMRTYLAQKH